METKFLGSSQTSYADTFQRTLITDISGMTDEEVIKKFGITARSWEVFYSPYFEKFERLSDDSAIITIGIPFMD